MKPTRQLGSSSPAANWYVQVGGQQRGPYAPTMIEQWIERAELPPDATLSDGGPWITQQDFQQRYGSGASSGPVSSYDQSGVGASAQTEGDGAPGAVEETAEALSSLVSDPVTADNANPAGRDRIVILGRRQAGKTTFLAMLYAQLWRSQDGLSAKALTGETHQRLMSIHQMLQTGRWPDATLGTSRIELEVQYHGRPMPLVTLDFAGELFSRAFMQDELDSPESRQLVEHIDRAAAVLLLIDPANAAGRDAQAAMEDDFGIVQAVERIRNWPGGVHVPVALVLTKMDQNQRLVERFGGARDFVRRHFPSLCRVVPQLQVFPTTAVESAADITGQRRPCPRPSPGGVDAPLRHCLRLLLAQMDQDQAREDQQWRQSVQQQAESERARRDRRQNRWLFVAILLIAMVGTGLVLTILALRL